MRGPATRGIAMACALVLACGSPSTPATNAERTRADIEALLARRADALARGDRAAYDTTYDASQPALRRWQTEEFAAATRGGGAARAPRVSRVELLSPGLARVYADIDTDLLFGFEADAHVVRLYVRQVGGAWVVSEPVSAALGDERRRELEGITIEHWAIDDDVIELVADEARSARDQVTRFAPRGFQLPVRVRIAPTAGSLGPGWPYGFIVQHSDREIVLPPVSVGLDASLRALSTPTRSVLRVGLAYALREQLLPGIGARLSNDYWLVDGWSVYAGGRVAQPDYFRSACAGVAPPSLKQLSEPIGPSVGSAADAHVLYAHMRSLIEHLYERYGAGAYWEILEAFRSDADSRVVLPKVLKVTPDAFYAQWLAWAKKKYC